MPHTSQGILQNMSLLPTEIRASTWFPERDANFKELLRCIADYTKSPHLQRYLAENFMSVTWGSLYSNRGLHPDLATKVRSYPGRSLSAHIPAYTSYNVLTELPKRASAGKVFGAYHCAELNTTNWLTEQYRADSTLLFIHTAPPLLDPLGYAAWSTFFNMIPTWNSELKALPEVVASLIKNR